MPNVFIVGVSQALTRLVSPSYPGNLNPPDLFVAAIEFLGSGKNGEQNETFYVTFTVPGAWTHPSIIQFFDELKESVHALLTSNVDLKRQLWIRTTTDTRPDKQLIYFADSTKKRFYHKDWPEETEPPKPIGHPVKKELVISRPLLVAQETAKRDIDLSVRLDEMNDQKQIPFTLILKDRLLPAIQVVYTGLLGFLADVGMKTLTVTDIDLTNAPAYSEVLGLEQLMMPPSYFFSRSECDVIWAKWGAGETNICPYVYSVSESVYALLPKYVVDTEMADGTYELNNRWMWGLWQSLIDRINLHVVSISNRLIIGAPMEMLEKPVAAKRVLELRGYLGKLNDGNQSPFEITLSDPKLADNRVVFKGYIYNTSLGEAKELYLTEVDLSQANSLQVMLNIKQLLSIPTLLWPLCPSNLGQLDTAGRNIAMLLSVRYTGWRYRIDKTAQRAFGLDIPEVVCDGSKQDMDAIASTADTLRSAGIVIQITE